LFTLIINIRDNAHPLSHSWNSSSDTRIGSMTCCSYHMRKSVYRYISLFFVTMLLLARLSFVANSPLNEVFTFTLPCLFTASRTRSTFSASFKNCRGSMWLEFITAFVNIRFSRRRSLARQEIVHCYSRTRHEMCRSNCDFAPVSCAILATTDCLCPTARRGRLARKSSSSCSMHLSHPLIAATRNTPPE